ncbi:hypothetical protein EV182_002850 [Spiromyces aspiralis]|uniref:Uncharacterized protein n=1 Tax=Spiromyces aspiralis TaxID=68401 RepID=A0ACC1HDG2_9FUNG|nr:hypothetical protein EV182_002850 [Spiromyces aspiralis]
MLAGLLTKSWTSTFAAARSLGPTRLALKNVNSRSITTSRSVAQQDQPPPLPKLNKKRMEEQQRLTQDILAELSMEQGISYGRSLAVHNGRPGHTYRMLNNLLNENGVREELRLRRRYEKPTLRRRREHREANARRFGQAVREKVQLVLKMKN